MSLSGALNIGTAVESTVVDVYRALASELRWTRPPLHGPAKPGEQRRSGVDPSAARAALGWEARVQAAEGLERTARWFQVAAAGVA